LLPPVISFSAIPEKINLCARSWKHNNGDGGEKIGLAFDYNWNITKETV
jgi:hypothetical protein